MILGFVVPAYFEGSKQLWGVAEGNPTLADLSLQQLGLECESACYTLVLKSLLTSLVLVMTATCLSDQRSANCACKRPLGGCTSKEAHVWMKCSSWVIKSCRSSFFCMTWQRTPTSTSQYFITALTIHVSRLLELILRLLPHRHLVQ